MLEIGYWNPSSNTNSINDIRNIKHTTDSSSPLNSINNTQQKSFKSASYTPISKEKSLKPNHNQSATSNNNTSNASGNNSINGNNNEYAIFMKKKMSGKRKEAPLSKLCNFLFLYNYQ